MKKLQFILFAVAIMTITACGGSTQTKDTHEHSTDCTDNHDSTSHNEATHQESFTVEVDSTHNHSDSCSHKTEKVHSHTHDDGKAHNH